MHYSALLQYFDSTMSVSLPMCHLSSTTDDIVTKPKCDKCHCWFFVFENLD